MADRAAAALGERAGVVEPLQGGALSSVVRLRLASGGAVVVKSGPSVAVEAGMLRAIRDSGAPAPEVLAVQAPAAEGPGTGEGLLVLEDLGADAGPGGAWASVGAGVRRLHAVTGARYGWPEDYAFGPVAIPNASPSGSTGAGRNPWPAFWAERRLMSGIEALPADLARRIEALCASLPDLLPSAPRPALLHGDLWPGNIHARDGRLRGLIDPACHCGDREVDLAMLTLFGTPGPAFWSAYGVLEPGAAERRPIYQLWPALVHLRLFGASYRGMVERLLDACGSGG